MNFFIAICIIVLAYTLILENINLGLWVKVQMYIFKPTLSALMNQWKTRTIVPWVLDMLFCFKPGVYGFAYTWVKVERTR